MHVPQMAVPSPLDKLELRNQRPRKPSAVSHLRCRQPWPHRPLIASGKFANGHTSLLKLLKELDQLSPRRSSKAVARAAGVDQSVAVVVAEDDRVKAFAPMV